MNHGVDHGPIFLVRDKKGDRERAVVDWGYNAWGGKYPPFDLDDAVPQHVARLRNLPLFPGIIMKWSLEVNGRGRSCDGSLSAESTAIASDEGSIEQHRPIISA
jgi:agmatine/peptidylarginine deiminase